MIEGAQDEGLTPNRKALQDTAEQACLEDEGLCGAGRGWVLPEAGEAARIVLSYFGGRTPCPHLREHLSAILSHLCLW